MRRGHGWTFPPLPSLSRSEAKALVVRAQAGDREARSHLILSHMRLVVMVAMRYRRQEDPAELIAIGIGGLMKSVDAFDVDHRDSFTAVATAWISNTILAYLKHESYRQHERLPGGALARHRGRAISPADEQDVSRLLDGLSEKESEVICLRYGVDGRPELSNAEIGRELRMNETTVRRIIRKALARMRELAA